LLISVSVSLEVEVKISVMTEFPCRLLMPIQEGKTHKTGTIFNLISTLCHHS